MVHDPDVLNLLESLQTESWSGTAYRHMFADLEPGRINYDGARWNPPGVGAIYCSLHRETALVEAEHRIAQQPMRPKAKRTLYMLSVQLGMVVDLRDKRHLAQAGITDVELTSVRFGPCQEIGRAVRFIGAHGLLVPSARGIAANLVIYPSDDFELEVVDQEIIDPGRI